jgi:hypothetical protein
MRPTMVSRQRLSPQMLRPRETQCRFTAPFWTTSPPTDLTSPRETRLVRASVPISGVPRMTTWDSYPQPLACRKTAPRCRIWALASPSALIAFLRIFAGPCVGIAVLNWMARNTAPSPARDAIVLANIVGFGCVTATDVWGVSSGDAGQSPRRFSWYTCCSRSRSCWRDAPRCDGRLEGARNHAGMVGAAGAWRPESSRSTP